jgi:glycosyltransferase involved in cell wall biosynthesis
MTRPAPRLLVIVPALNEEASLPAVLRELRAWSSTAGVAVDILVVDDGSTDTTASVARAEGATVAPLPFNLGVGGALQTGFRYAVRNRYERAIQFDADGQHDASQIPALLAALDAGADLVIGSRFSTSSSTGYDVGRMRSGAMRGLRIAVRLLGGRSFSDASSGFRGFSAPLLEFFAGRYPSYYLGDTAEALLLACQAGFDVVEVPVTMRTRAGGIPSTRSVKLAFHYLRAIVSMASRMPLRRARNGTTGP